MKSIGVFREGEIDGKPFHIFTLLPQTDTQSSSSYSGDDDLPPPFQPLFICQSFRSNAQWWHQRQNVHPVDFVPVDVYPHFYNKRSGDEQFQYLIGSDTHEHKCKLPLVPLFWCNNEEPNPDDFECGVCESLMLGTDYYICVTCGYKYHKECIESPLEIKHPSFPLLSLKLYYRPQSNLLECICCHALISEMFYYFPTYKLILDPICAMKPIPILIDHPKRHPHTLTFFPKQVFLPCNVCGLTKEPFPTYVCARCVFLVHQDCVNSPNVIRISRHKHHISFTYSLPSGNFSCGVCRRKVNNNYGAYSCNNCDDYFVHSKCALPKDLWDGKELEGIPEEPEIAIEPPFKRISDGIILHFSHDHHLKLEMSGVYDDGKVCQACVLPIYEGSYYSCIDCCDFILHEVCANAPLRIQHPLHSRSLALEVFTYKYDDNVGFFDCDACRRISSSFVYKDLIGEHGWHCRLDLRCASILEPFNYEGHDHPLFLALTLEEEESAKCQICQEVDDEIIYSKKLTCIECKFILCFKCATLPYKARYQYDKHFLTFRKKEEANNNSGWCDKCEKKIEYSRKGGFYSCDDYCSTTLHVDCLLGEIRSYFKPGHSFMYRAEEVHIHHNKTMSRPFCHGKEHRCVHKVVFQMKDMTFCSKSCLYQFEQ